jgi:hypothetical protein
MDVAKVMLPAEVFNQIKNVSVQRLRESNISEHNARSKPNK